ncbi:MAG TPA: NADH-quinone oxidoreductase subunit J [Oculatellaceae cyanobacterium]
MDQLISLQSWMTANADNFEAACVYIVAAIAIPFAYGVIFDTKIIRSGFLLIGVFGGISALFMLLQAQFLAMAQIMIYAVGITLVVVIALMLTNPKSEHEDTTAIPANRYLGFVVSLFVFMTIYMSLFGESFPLVTDKLPGNNLLLIGTELCTTYALPFEFASILLLAAVVGAIMLAKNEKHLPNDDDDDDFATREEFTLKNDSNAAVTTSR